MRFATVLRACVATFLCASAALAAPARVAVVIEPPGHPIPPAVTLAEAALAGPDIAIVEREAVDRVLAEQRDATALGTGDGSVRLGKMLSAEVLAVVHCDDATSGPTGLVVFDAVTGARLWDGAVPADAASAADTMATAVRAALVKRALPVDRRRTACLFSVRNVDLPRSQDAFCEAVGRLVERRLTASPDVAVLERARLDRVNAERSLPTADAADNRLLASVTLVTLDVARTDKPGDVRVTAVLTDTAGRSVGTATLSPASDGGPLASATADAICRQLRAAVPPVPADPRAEAHRFTAETTFGWAHRDPASALRAAEAAHALDPDDVPIDATLARARMEQARDLLTEGGWVIDHAWPAARWADSFALFESGLNEFEAATHHAARNGRSPLLVLEIVDADDLARRYVADLAGYGFDPHAPPAAAADIRHAYRRFWLDVLEPLAFAGTVDRPSYEAYARQVGHELGSGIFSTAGPIADQWPDDLLTALHRWAPLAVRFPRSSGRGESSTHNMLTSIATEWSRPALLVAGHEVDHRPWSTADLDRWQAVFATLAASRDAESVALARDGLQWVDRARAILTSGRALGQFGPVHGKFARISDMVRSGRAASAAAATRPTTRSHLSSAEAAHTIVPFQTVRPLVDLTTDISDVAYFAPPVVHGRNIFTVAMVVEPDGTPQRTLFRFDLDAAPGTPPTRLGTGPALPSRLANRVNREGDLDRRLQEAWFATYSQHTFIDTNIDTDAYWVVTSTHVDAFPLTGGPAKTFDTSAMPSPTFQSVAPFDGHLYAAVGKFEKEAYLVDQDLATGTVRTLASARRAEKLSPFDAGPPFVCKWMRSDPPRHRLLFYAESPLWQADTGGLWEYRPATNQFRQLVPAAPFRSKIQTTADAGWVAFSGVEIGPIIDGRFVVEGYNTVYTYDLAADRQTPLVIRNSGVGYPYTQAGDWVYGQYGRFQPGHPTAGQRFGDLRPSGHYASPTRYKPAHVLPVNADQVLIGDAIGLWLVTFGKP